MPSEAELTIHRCECDICKTGIDPETARHHHRVVSPLGVGEGVRGYRLLGAA